MNKKISELISIVVGEEGYIPIVEASTGETKKISIADIHSSIGDIKSSMLTSEQFNSINYGTWMLMNGQTCSGTSYEALTGNTSVPDMVTEGAFPRQAKSDADLGVYQGDAIRNITGTIATLGGGGTVNGAFLRGSNNAGALANSGEPDYHVSFSASRVVPTAEENRPKNNSFNFFIRVN